MRRCLLFWVIALLLVVPSLTPDVAVAQGGGTYRLTSVTHTIGTGGYRTSFEVRKEIV